MTDRPTPETDAEHAQFAMGGFTLDFCRRLERERDEARALSDMLAGELLKICSLSQTTCMTFETQSFKATEISMQAWRKWKEARNEIGERQGIRPGANEIKTMETETWADSPIHDMIREAGLDNCERTAERRAHTRREQPINTTMPNDNQTTSESPSASPTCSRDLLSAEKDRHAKTLIELTKEIAKQGLVLDRLIKASQGVMPMLNNESKFLMAYESEVNEFIAAASDALDYYANNQ